MQLELVAIPWYEGCEFVAFDLETTGLFPASERILEIGAVRFGHGRVLAIFDELVDPGIDIPEAVTGVHGITPDMVRGRPPIEEVLPRFFEFLGDGDTLLLGHYVGFDADFVAVEACRVGLTLPRHLICDTWALARARLPGLARYDLGSVARALGVDGAERHRALADAQTTRQAFEYLLREPTPIGCPEELLEVGRGVCWDREARLDVEVPAGFEPLAEAMENGRSLTVVYGGGTRGRSPRKLTPRRVLQLRGTSYLVALCHLDGVEKTFRLDRLQSLALEN